MQSWISNARCVSFCITCATDNVLYKNLVMLLVSMHTFSFVHIYIYVSLLKKRKTALIYAIQGGGDKEVVKELCTAGGNVSIKDKVGHHCRIIVGNVHT